MGTNDAVLYSHIFITALYGMISVLAVAGFVRGRSLRYFTGAAVTLFACVLALRWSITGHPPIFGVFEETLAAGFFMGLFTVIYDKDGTLTVFSMPVSFLTLLYGFLYDTDLKPLIISEQSLWVDFHALFAWLTYAFYFFAFVGAVFVLLGRKADSKLLDWFFTRGILFGFTAQSLYFFMGSYYSSRLHGNWWMWDPVEYLFMVSWFIYAAIIHGRIFFGWSRSKIAWWNVAGFAFTMALYWGLVYMPWATYHIFETNIKMHF